MPKRRNIQSLLTDLRWAGKSLFKDTKKLGLGGENLGFNGELGEIYAYCRTEAARHLVEKRMKDRGWDRYMTGYAVPGVGLVFTLAPFSGCYPTEAGGYEVAEGA